VLAPKQHTEKSFKALQAALYEFFGFTDKAGIYSLSKSPFEELLWAHYSCSHTGFCIEYDLEKLLEFEAQDFIKIDVLYRETPPKLSIDDLTTREASSAIQKILGTKPQSWNYEKEIRIITPAIGRHDYDFRALKTIFFGLRMPEDEKQQIMKQLQGRGISYKQIILSKGTYKLSAIDIQDPYQNTKRYKYSIAPIATHAIMHEHTKECFKEYSKYLYKAAEIVRREPYCQAIELVQFSHEKSTPENPVVLVQYKRKEYRWVNHYLSLPEIDELYLKVDDITTPLNSPYNHQCK